MFFTIYKILKLKCNCTYIPNTTWRTSVIANYYVHIYINPMIPCRFYIILKIYIQTVAV